MLTREKNEKCVFYIATSVEIRKKILRASKELKPVISNVGSVMSVNTARNMENFVLVPRL